MIPSELDRELKQGSPEGGSASHKWFTWLTGAVAVLALSSMKAFGIITVVLIQPEVTMGIINNVVAQQVMFAALIETAWSICVNRLTSGTSS